MDANQHSELHAEAQRLLEDGPRGDVWTEAWIETAKDVIASLIEQAESAQTDFEIVAEDRQRLREEQKRLLEQLQATEQQRDLLQREADCEHGMGEDARRVAREIMAERDGLKEQLESAQQDRDEYIDIAERLGEQLETLQNASELWQMIESRDAIIIGLQEQSETLDEALREILDVTEKWTRRMTDEERLLHIDTIAKAALPKVSKTKR